MNCLAPPVGGPFRKEKTVPSNVNWKWKGRQTLKNKVLRLMRERGSSQAAIDAYLKDCEEKPPKTINECCYEDDPFVDWDKYEVNEVWACISIRQRDWCA